MKKIILTEQDSTTPLLAIVIKKKIERQTSPFNWSIGDGEISELAISPITQENLDKVYTAMENHEVVEFYSDDSTRCALHADTIDLIEVKPYKVEHTK